jgi:hypothetical protein
MALHIESNVESPEQLTEFLKSQGMDVPEVPGSAGTEATVPPAKGKEKQPDSEVNPKDKATAGSEGETGTESETTEKKDKSQEHSPGGEKKGKKAAEVEGGKKEDELAVDPPATQRGKTSKGGVPEKLATLTREKQRLEDALEDERGSKTKLQAELDEVKGKLAALAPKEDAKPAELVRPKRPTMAEHEFDNDKFEAALSKYETDLEAFQDAKRAKERQEDEAKFQKTLEQRDQQRVIERQEAEFGERLKASIAGYDDFYDLIQQIPPGTKDITVRRPLVKTYIDTKSKAPGHLIRFFMQDYLDGETEATRIEAMDDFDASYELRAIEQRLIDEQKGTSNGTKTATAAAETEEEPVTVPPQERVPAREQPTGETVDRPIGSRTVGSRATASRPSTLEEAAEKGAREYREARNRELAAKQRPR